MKIIDTHLHFWCLANNINSWVLNESNKNLHHDYLPDNLLKQCTEELLGVVHLEAHDSRVSTFTEIKWLKEQMRLYQNLQYRHIAFADLTMPYGQFKNIVDQLKDFPEVVGIRHILSHNPKFKYNPNDIDLSMHENIQYNLAYLAQNNLIFACQVYPRQMMNILPTIIKTNVTTVIDHMLLPAWHKNNDEDHNLWKNQVSRLAKLENVYLKLSGLDMLQNPTEYDQILGYCLDKFTFDKLLYASNYPVSSNTNYNDWFNYLNTLKISFAEKEQLFYKNAALIFKMSL